MKKILLTLSLSTLTCLCSVSFAQSVQTPNFSETYNRLIDQVVVIQKTEIGSAVMNSGVMNMNFKMNAGPKNNGNMTINMNSVTITNTTKKGSSLEMSLNVKATINGTMENQSVNDLGLTMAGQVILTPTMVYYKLDNLTVDSSKLPTEIQGQAEMVIGYLKGSGLMGKRIRNSLPKEMKEAMKESMKLGNTSSSEMIVTILKQYPLIENISYENNVFNVKLDEKNVTEMMNTMLKIRGKKKGSKKDIKDTINVLEKLNIKGTLTNSNIPVLSLTSLTETSDSSATIQGTISQESINLSGVIVMPARKADMKATIKNNNLGSMEYIIDLGFISDPGNSDGDFGLNINGSASTSMIGNYKLITPKKSLTTQQAEKKMEKMYE